MEETPKTNSQRNEDGQTYQSNEMEVIREQDLVLPVANITRLMKMALPSQTKIAKDAKETMQECVSEFIAFITSEASDKCLQEKRKTINGDDILWAIEELGFLDYSNLLKIYLQKYKDNTKSDKDLEQLNMDSKPKKSNISDVNIDGSIHRQYSMRMHSMGNGHMDMAHKKISQTPYK